MSNILNLQGLDSVETPEAAKKRSQISIKWCGTSKVSVAICWVK